MTMGGKAGHIRKETVLPVQWLRGVAACLVVAIHLIERLLKRGAFQQGLPDWIWSCGQIGVGTFFAISGFIMVYTMADEFGQVGAGRRFLLRRFLRVVPIYYLTSLLMIAFSFATFRWSTQGTAPVVSFPLVMKSFAFLPYIDAHHRMEPVYALGWTLNYEMFFYLVFALAITMPRGAGLAAALFCLAALVLAGTRISAPPLVEGRLVPFYYFTRPVLLYFMAGMAIGMLRLVRGPWRVAVSEGMLCAIATIPLVVGLLFSVAEMTPASLLSASLALALGSLLQGRPGTHGTWFTTLARRFGDVSYSMYLTHSFLLGAMAVVMARLATGHVWLLGIMIALACLACALAAWLVWRYIERPLTRFLMGRLTARS